MQEYLDFCSTDCPDRPTRVITQLGIPLRDLGFFEELKEISQKAIPLYQLKNLPWLEFMDFLQKLH